MSGLPKYSGIFTVILAEIFAHLSLNAIGAAQVKIYHPDVYKGDGDSQDMMLRLIRAYEVYMT